jgi:hypothetical protein
MGLLPGSRRFFVDTYSQFWQPASAEVQAEVLLIPAALGPSLDGPECVVQTLEATQRHPVRRAAIGLDAVEDLSLGITVFGWLHRPKVTPSRLSEGV